MSERLTWEEIVARFPDEWVLVVDIDEERTDSFLVAAVADHGMDRDVMEQRFARMKVPSGIFYTGLMSELPLALSL